MLDAVQYLWELLTVFFNVTVVTDPFFLGLLMFSLVFATIYIFIHFFDGSFVRW